MLLLFAVVQALFIVELDGMTFYETGPNNTKIPEWVHILNILRFALCNMYIVQQKLDQACFRDYVTSVRFVAF